MFETLENGIGLDIVTGLQAGGSPILDALARALHLLGGDLGYLLLLPVIYWSVSRHFGRQLLFVLLVALVGMIGMKELLARPRPFVLHPDVVTPLFLEDGFGLPSGHVTLAMVIWGFIVYHARRWWAWLLLALYVLLVGWSRMYAGVHFPQDVIGGVIWGGLLLAFALLAVRPAARWWGQAALWQRLAFALIAGIVVGVLLRGDSTGLSAAGILIGGGFGLAAEERILGFVSGGSRRQRVIRSAAGLALTLILFFGLSALFSALTPAEVWRVARYALVAFTLIFVWPWLSARVGLTARRSAEPA